MKTFSVLVLAGVVSGCGKTGPTLSGGKPVAYWVKTLGDPDTRLRKTAVLKLGNAGPTDPAAFPALLGALKDHDAGIRCDVILALLKFGPEAREAAGALAQMRRHDPDARVRDFAGKALVKMEGE